jgi:hypothetical protein
VSPKTVSACHPRITQILGLVNSRIEELFPINDDRIGNMVDFAADPFHEKLRIV